ncbi:MAG: hypothetical protein ABH851_03345 [Methanobacteriota archaeon]
MENAIVVPRASEIGKIEGEYGRVYLGDEFCERLLPSEREVEKIVKKAGSTHLTLVTPYLTDSGISRARKLLDLLPEKTEVVLNDWGLLAEVQKRNLSPVLGRLLLKYKRDPRLELIESKIPKACLEVLHSSALTQNRFKEFLIKQGIGRIELDNTIALIDHGDLKGFKVSVHVPYVYVSTTRQCLTHFMDSGEFGIKDCEKECLKKSYVWESKRCPFPLIQRGNTLFYENSELGEIRGVDRIVHHEKITP